MIKLCAMGLHRFVRRRATHRPTTIVSRCERCGATRVRHTTPRADPGVGKPSWSYAPNVKPVSTGETEDTGRPSDQAPARRAAGAR